MSKTPSLTDMILEHVNKPNQRSTTWFHHLPAALQNELMEIKARHRRGDIGVTKMQLGRAIRQAVTDHGHRCVNAQGIVRWLDAD